LAKEIYERRKLEEKEPVEKRYLSENLSGII